MTMLCCLPPCTTRFALTRRQRRNGGPWYCPAHQYAGDTLIARLERLTRIRVLRNIELSALGVRLVDHGIKSTYRDCVALGREPEASKLMHELAVQLAAGGGG